MNLTTWTLLIAVVSCLVNIVILMRRVKRLESMLLRQNSINHNLSSGQLIQETELDKLKLRTRYIDNQADNIARFASKENDVMDDVTTLLSGTKANCFSIKVGTDKKFFERLNIIKKRA